MARTHFPRGQMTLGGSVLVNVDEVSFETNNNLALKATLAQPNGIPVDGMRVCTIKCKVLLSNDQTEREAEMQGVSMVLAGTGAEPLPLGYKNGALTIQAYATPSTVTLSDKLGDPATLDFTAMGFVADSQGI